MATFRAMGGGIPSGHNYSTTEQVIGTDVDGSVVYERTWYADSVSINTNTNIDSTFTTTGLKRVIKFEGAAQINNSPWTMIPLDFQTSGSSYGISFSMNNTGVLLNVQSYTVTGYHLTIQYVKN